MTLAAAQQFIQRAINDPDMVSRMNAAPDGTAIRQILEQMNLPFDKEEFDPAYVNMLTWCQTHEQAEAVKEIRVWWDFLWFTLQGPAVIY
jgi:hypothetical protein